MLPVGEINLVVGGIATFAASVGYVFTRRLRADPRSTEDSGPDQSDSATNTPMDSKKAAPDELSVSVTYEEPTTSLDVCDPKTIANPMESEPIESAPILPQSRRSSLALKRKRSFDDDDDDPPADAGYPHNLATIYPPPKKRSRTPSTDEKTDPDVSAAGAPSTVDQGAAKEVEPPSTDLVADNTAEKSPSVATPEPDSSNRVPLPSPPRTPKHSPRKVNEPLPTPSTSGFFGTMPSPSTPRTPLPSPRRAATTNAFSAFSGTASPFASFRAASPSRADKPVWTSKESDVARPTVVAPNEVSVSHEANATSSAPRRPKNGHALEAVLASKSTVEYLTGEENEDVELELKGVKLYIKRGDKPFADGVIGHIKLLSNKTTLDERLLFRREPLWKVSMNVRIHPSVRCTYEAEENIIRLILHECIEIPNVPQEDWKKEIVVYALKPGRSCSKQDFKDFATSLVECPGLKPR